jgi:hypothetical protein
MYSLLFHFSPNIIKGKAIPSQAWTGSEGSRRQIHNIYTLYCIYYLSFKTLLRVSMFIYNFVIYKINKMGILKHVAVF